MSQRDKYEESEVCVFSFHAGREDDNKVTDGRTDKCTQFPISSGSVRKEGSKPVTDCRVVVDYTQPSHYRQAWPVFITHLLCIEGLSSYCLAVIHSILAPVSSLFFQTSHQSAGNFCPRWCTPAKIFLTSMPSWKLLEENLSLSISSLLGKLRM